MRIPIPLSQFRSLPIWFLNSPTGGRNTNPRSDEPVRAKEDDGIALDHPSDSCETQQRTQILGRKPRSKPKSRLGFSLRDHTSYLDRDQWSYEEVRIDEHSSRKPCEEWEPNDNYSFVRSLPEKAQIKRRALIWDYINMYEEVISGTEYEKQPFDKDLRKDDRSVSYRTVFQSHVCMFVFGVSFNIRGLPQTAVVKLYALLYDWVLYPERVEDVIFLVEYVFGPPIPDRHTDKSYQKLQECVLSFVAAMWYDLAGYLEWQEFIDDGGEFTEAIARFLGDHGFSSQLKRGSALPSPLGKAAGPLRYGCR